MNSFEEITPHISCLSIPYKGIYTTVCLIKTEAGVLLFDAASYDSDITDIVLPALAEAGIGEDELKYIFISHKHADHAGGLGELLKHFPGVCVLSRSDALREQHAGYEFSCPEEWDTVLGELKVVCIPGHTPDSAALLDTRTKTLVCGDCLQMYGIFGEGKWGANIRLPKEHIAALDKLRGMDIDKVICAPASHPCGRILEGKENILAAIDACAAPLYEIKALIEENPDADDVAVCAAYNSRGNLPTLGDHVVTAVRRDMCGKEVHIGLSVCGIKCESCNFYIDKKCEGCRSVAPEGKCVWNGRCDLYDCCAARSHEHCGKCSDFPCSTLKEWAAGENGERIQNLVELNKLN